VISGKVTLLDGTVINQSQGAETRVDAAIDGGIEALQLMRVGCRWQIVVPPDMAHGPGGQMPKIGPNETIVGVIELVAIK
ncbi:MAG: FKBP-type peptidyl-prolyl cis-trans isomerase, partial [Phycisphaerales bacterium]